MIWTAFITPLFKQVCNSLGHIHTNSISQSSHAGSSRDWEMHSGGREWFTDWDAAETLQGPGWFSPENWSKQGTAHKKQEATLVSHMPGSEGRPTNYCDFCKIDCLTLHQFELKFCKSHITWLGQTVPVVYKSKCVYKYNSQVSV